MRNEELDRLKAKYLAGNTSLEEERQLKELEEDAFFAALKQGDKSSEQMDWDFDAFMQDVDTKETNEQQPNKVRPLFRMIIGFSALAASLLLAFFLIRNNKVENATELTNTLAHQEVEPSKPRNEVETILDVPAKDFGKQEPLETEVKTSPTKPPMHLARDTKSTGQNKAIQAIEELDSEGLYVEVNGVRIYDEEKALEVTESALQLATANLKAGMKSVEKIKYLSIEI
ncbi:hypothetical protein [Sphingobacterium kyonggiense]